MGCNSLTSPDLDATSRALSAPVIAEGEGFEPPKVVTPLRFSRPPSDSPKSIQDNGLRPNGTPLAHHLPTDNRPTSSPDLELVIASWSDLPEALRAGILAMVKSASGKAGGEGER